jgi:cation-transporting ATPase E
MSVGVESFPARLHGLSSAEALDRARTMGTNRFEARGTRSYVRIVMDHALPAANVALFTVSIVLLALGLYIDALLTSGLVLGNVAVGVFQEVRAKRQLDRIVLLAKEDAHVMRDGVEQRLDPGDIVVGDIVIIRPGDQLPADGVVVEEENCSIDESLLTGESELIRKTPGDAVYSGSFCMTGRAAYRCDRIGREGFGHRIAARAKETRTVRTPLQREVGYVLWGVAILVALLSIGVVRSFYEIYGGVPLVEATRAAAVVVALIPQGLWVMVTVTYAVAIIRISPLGTLVQRLNAIESMSHVDVLCLDKTGTITTNVLAVDRVHPLTVDEATLRRLLGRYCSSVSIGNRSTEAIAAAMGEPAHSLSNEVQFDSLRRWSAVSFFDTEQPGVFVLGAPEILAQRIGDSARFDLVGQWVERGLRVLLLAHESRVASIEYVNGEPRLPELLVPLGYVVLRDELRPGAHDVIARFFDTGIAVKVISGDHPLTVAALAREAGIPDADYALAGDELPMDDPQALAVVADETVVFGRVVPDQKERIIEALKSRGRYVAMIGDGVNDVPAMKRAHVSIAMRAGSPVTRGIADIILLNDSFASLPSAFSEGRRIRAGMEMIIRIFLVRTLSVALIILGAAILASEFPLTPRHTAILSTVTVGTPALFLAAWAKPTPTNRYLIPASGLFVIPAAVTLGIMGVAVYEFELARSDSVADARTLLTAAAAAAGVMLIPFVDDEPSAWMTVRGLIHPARTAVLGVCMLVSFGLAMALELPREFYELTVVNWRAWLIATTALTGWIVTLHFLWRWVGSGISILNRPKTS